MLAMLKGDDAVKCAALFAAAGNDVRELCRLSRERQVTSGRTVLRAGDADTHTPGEQTGEVSGGSYTGPDE